MANQILYGTVLWAGMQLLLTSLILFIAGHRLKTNGFFVSLLLATALSSSAWLIQSLYIGDAPSFFYVLIVTLIFSSLVTFAFKDWSAIGHASFYSLLVAAIFFVGYLGHGIYSLQIGIVNWFFVFLLFSLQLVSIIFMMFYMYDMMDVICRVRWNKISEKKVIPGYAPMVSIHVPAYNEPPELLMETLNALAKLDYPNFEVLLIDNNTVDENVWKPVEEHCAKLGSRFRFFHLLPWKGYKAGALNYALTQTNPNAEIVGVIDADYIVSPNYLHDLVGYFSDPQMGFVQTPQAYRDTETRGRFGTALGLSYRYFFDINMPGRNEHNSIIFCGTMGLIRKAALERIGGWDEWCITEDAETSLRIVDLGYTSVYINKVYGRGLMPMDMAGLKKQMFRWSFGAMQIIRKHFHRLINPWAGGHLSTYQRIGYWSLLVQWLNNFLIVAFSAFVFIGALGMLTGRTYVIQPVYGKVLIMPVIFLYFELVRFIWGFRVRSHCKLSDAMDAFILQVGLAYVIAFACIRGLICKNGVFLRTPKKGNETTLLDSLHVVWQECVLSILCMAAFFSLILTGSGNIFSPRGLLALLSFWEGLIYMGALRASIWNYFEINQTTFSTSALAWVHRTTEKIYAGPITRRLMNTKTAASLVSMLGSLKVIKNMFWGGAVLLFLSATPNKAYAIQEVVSGWEGNSLVGYGFVAPSYSGDHELGPSLMLRGSVSYMNYKYLQNNHTTYVRSPGIGLSMGLRYRTAKSDFILAPGIEARRKEIETSVETKHESKMALTALAVGYTKLTSLASWLTVVSYGAADHYLWARTGIKQQITHIHSPQLSNWSLGAEVTGHGNREIRAYAIGPMAELSFPKQKLSVQFHSGITKGKYKDSKSKSDPYFGIGLYWAH